MAFDNLILFITTSIILALIPGQDMLFVIARSLSHGRGAGLIGTLGLMIGVCFHILLAATGLSAIILSSSTAFSIIKYMGAAYLIYLGIKAWRNKIVFDLHEQQISQEKNLNNWKIFKEGIISSTLNPKLALFFISFLPQFISPESDPFAQFLVLGILFIVSALPILIATTFLSAYLRKLLTHHSQAQKYSQWISGSTLIVLGLYLATTEKTQ